MHSYVRTLKGFDTKRNGFLFAPPRFLPTPHVIELGQTLPPPPYLHPSC